MTTTVTMLQTRLGESGSLWTVGNSYAASDAFAAVLISSNLATGTLPKSRSLVPLWGQTDSTGAVASVVDAGGNSIDLFSNPARWVTTLGVFPLSLTDTTTDQTTILQAAIDAATAGGYGLFFPPGRYNYNGLMTGCGCSMRGVIGATEIHSIRSDGKNTRFDFVSRSNIVIDGIIFKVDNTPISPSNNGLETDAILRFNTGTNITVQNCDFYNAYGTPVLMRSVTYGIMDRCRAFGSWKDSFHITGLSRFVTRRYCLVENGGDDAFPVVGYRSTGTTGQPTDVVDAFSIVRGVKAARAFAYVGAARVVNYGCFVDGTIPASYSPLSTDYCIAGLYIHSELGFDSYHNEDILVDGMKIYNCGGSATGGINIQSRTGVSVSKDITLKNITVKDSAKHGLYVDGAASGQLTGLRIENLIVDGTIDANGRLGTAGTGSAPGVEIKNAGNFLLDATIRETGGEGVNLGTSIEETVRLNLRTYNINVSGLAGKDILFVGPATTAKEIYIDLQVAEQPQINSAGTAYYIDRIVECTGNTSRVRKLDVRTLTNYNKGIATGLAEQSITVTASPMTWVNTNPYPVLFRITNGSGLTVQRGTYTGVAAPVFTAPNTSKVSGYYMCNPGEAMKVTYSSAPTLAYLPSFE